VGAPETVKGFLAAVHDCCLAVAKEGPVPDFAVGELAKRSCLDPEATKQSRRRRRIRRLIESVQDAEEPSQVEHACRALAELGPEAHDATPALIEALKQGNRFVTLSATYALGRIGVSAIPALATALKDASIADGVCGALHQIGSASVPALLAV
jgi:hypothetical protein